jgi:hypothetical protein
MCVSHTLVVSESLLVVVVTTAVVLSVRYALRPKEQLNIEHVLVMANYMTD